MNPQKELTSSEVKMILESVADGVFTVDADFVVTSFNQAAARITGVPVSQALGKPCCEVFRADICESDCALKRTVQSGKPVVNLSVNILRADGVRAPISVSTAVLRDAEGRLVGGVETFRDLSVVVELRKEVEKSYSFEDIISRNPQMREIFAILPDVAASGSTILIEGESGTGKELMAKAIHSLSPRRSKPMVAMNCGAIPDTLLESELFGYKAGAFTDAKKDKPGRFAMAQGGTLFLDEIGDVSPALQVRLLRVLQEKCYEPLGSSQSVQADVRILAASNKDIRALVEQGVFREDLFYRIQVFRLALPPLRDRKEDVPLLARHFIDKFNRLKGKTVTGLSAEAFNALLDYGWPGNIRELENAIEHAFILCRGGLIEPGHLPSALRPARHAGDHPPSGFSLAQLEDWAIREALVRNKGKKTAAARELGINKTTLWRKMKRIGLDHEGEKGQ
jgi:sigma-54 dependent transcriptional regulator, acetoin dehydrogenase operon transcriptional activator AcoR